jgi:hypothetical protein
MTTDDHQLLNELNRLGDTFGSSYGGILTGQLSVAEQLDFSYQLIVSAGHIWAWVATPSSNKSQGIPGDGL